MAAKVTIKVKGTAASAKKALSHILDAPVQPTLREADFRSQQKRQKNVG